MFLSKNLGRFSKTWSLALAVVMVIAFAAGFAPGDSYAQSCDTSEAIEKARNAFDWHSSNGDLAPFFWRTLNTLKASNLPAKPAEVSNKTISRKEIMKESDGKPWGGWAPIRAAFTCLFPPDPEPEPDPPTNTPLPPPPPTNTPLPPPPPTNTPLPPPPPTNTPVPPPPPTNTPLPPPPPTNTPLPPPPPTNTPAAALQQQQQQPQANPPQAQKSSLQGVGSQDQQVQGRNFWIKIHFDTGDGNGVIDEGGMVIMQVRTNSDPGFQFVHIEARRGVREWNAYPNGAINWDANPGTTHPDILKYISNWANVGDAVANTSRDTLTSTGEAQKGLTGFSLANCPGTNDNQDNLKNNHTGNNCVGGSYTSRDGTTLSNWTRDFQAGEWYTEFMIDSTDDGFIGPAQRVYEFKVFNTSSTVAPARVVVTEDNSPNPGEPGTLSVKQLPLIPGQNDWQGVKIETGRAYYRNYRILISLGGVTNLGGSDYDSASDMSISVPKGTKYAEFSRSITCWAAGDGYAQVQAWPQSGGPVHATKIIYTPAATHSGRNVIRVCR